MKRVLVFLAVALLALPAYAAAGASPDDTKWVRGTVSAVGADSVTVKVRGKEMKFTVDKDTEVVARGAGTATREAQARGAAGAKLTEIIKVGDGAEVHYHEMGAMLHAAEIRGIAPTSGATSEDSGKSVRGTVTAVSADSLTVKTSDREWKFTVDAKTTVIGRGAGTMAREKREAGAAGPRITDLINVKDQVSVIYHEMGSILHAGEVRITRRSGATE